MAVRSALGDARDAGDALPTVLKIWIASDGALERVEFPPLTQAEANPALRALLLGRRLGPPPRDMLQPLRIAIAPED